MPGAGYVSRDPWQETMEKTLLDVFTAGLDENDDWKKIWVMKQSSKRREEVLEYSRPDVVEETPEGSPYVQLRMEKIRTTSAVHVDYTGMIRITHQMVRDKMYDQMEAQSWGLGEAINRKLCEEAVRYYYEGFSSVLGPDGVSWFNATHTCANDTSVTWSNLATGALDPDAFNAAQVLMQKTRNENGKITPYGQKRLQLIVSSANGRLAKQLAMKGKYEPNSHDFNENVFEIDPVILPMLNMAPSAYVDSQYYLRDANKAENYCFMREGPSFDTFIDPLTDDLVVKARVAFSFMIASSRGVVGSKGL